MDGWGFQSNGFYSVIYLYSNWADTNPGAFLTTNNNNGKLIKSVIIMIHSEMNELAVFIE